MSRPTPRLPDAALLGPRPFGDPAIAEILRSAVAVYLLHKLLDYGYHQIRYSHHSQNKYHYAHNAYDILVLFPAGDICFRKLFIQSVVFLFVHVIAFVTFF